MAGEDFRGLADLYGDDFGVQSNVVRALGTVVFGAADTGVVAPFGASVPRPALPSAAAVVSVASQNTNDDAAGSGLLTATIDYLDADYVQAVETITLDGQTAVTSSASMLRVNGFRNASAGSGKVNAGIVTVTQDAGAAALTGVTATKATPAVLSKSSHGLVDGDVVLITGMAEMTELNGRVFEVNQINATTFSLQQFDGSDLDSAGFGSAETTGGTVDKHVLLAMMDTDGDQAGDGASLQAIYTVPAARYLVIERWSAWYSAVIAGKVSLVAEDENGVRRVLDRQYSLEAQVSAVQHGAHTPIVVPPKTDLYAYATVGGAATVQALIEGMLRPKRG